MRRLLTPRFAITLGALEALVTVAVGVLAAADHQLIAGYWSLLLMALPFAAVGVIVACRQPVNPIGWIMLAASFVLAIGADGGMYAVLAYRDGHAGLPLARLAVWLAPSWLSIVFLPPILVLFPDGRVPAGRWRTTVLVYALIAGAFVITSAVGDLGAFTESRPAIDSGGILLRLDGGLYVTVTEPLFLGYVILFLAWIVRLGVSFRAATGERRPQLKWLLSGGAISAGGLLASTLLSTSHAAALQALSNVGALALGALPLSIGVAVLKYRLFDIDRIISRTLAYAVLSALLVGTFVGLVALTTDLLPFSSSVGVAASTLAAAALFNPLRIRVQRAVDRRFNRAHYDAEATVNAFAQRLRDAVDLDAVSADLLGTVRQAVEPAHATLWVRLGSPLDETPHAGEERISL